MGVHIEYLIVDVDGTLTDGGIYYDENGNEIKKFCTKDGTAIACARTAGIRVIILTGRECDATFRRMKELNVDGIYQNISNKANFLDEWMKGKALNKDSIGYVGDDINDISSMRLCGFSACPSDATDEVKEVVNYVSNIEGGRGVLMDVIRFILKQNDMWEVVVEKTYGAGI